MVEALRQDGMLLCVKDWLKMVVYSSQLASARSGYFSRYSVGASCLPGVQLLQHTSYFILLKCQCAGGVADEGLFVSKREKK